MNDELTLQEGLDEFNKKNSKYFSGGHHSSAGEEFLKHHDIAHIVFGCDTSIYGEGVVKIWTTFGTTLSFWKVVNGYKDASAFELARKYSFSHVVKNIFKFLLTIPKTIIRAKQMNKPWPFYDFDSYLNVPLSEIRKEFNIRVL